MKLLLAVLAVLLVLSVLGFIIKTLFWLGVIAAVAFVAVAIYGAAKEKLDGGTNRAIR